MREELKKLIPVVLIIFLFFLTVSHPGHISAGEPSEEAPAISESSDDTLEDDSSTEDFQDDSVTVEDSVSDETLILENPEEQIPEIIEEALQSLEELETLENLDEPEDSVSIDDSSEQVPDIDADEGLTENDDDDDNTDDENNDELINGTEKESEKSSSVPENNSQTSEQDSEDASKVSGEVPKLDGPEAHKNQAPNSKDFRIWVNGLKPGDRVTINITPGQGENQPTSINVSVTPGPNHQNSNGQGNNGIQIGIEGSGVKDSKISISIDSAGTQGTQNPGTQPPGTQNTGTKPPGTQPPDTQNPGNQNPGTQPPGTKPPGTQGPGTGITGTTGGGNSGIQPPGTGTAGTSGGTTAGTGSTGSSGSKCPTGSSREIAQGIKKDFGISVLNGSGQWSREELTAIYKTLEVLPENFRKSTSQMIKEAGNGGLLGMGELGGDRIWLYGNTSVNTVIHEMTHNFQGNSKITNEWRQTFWGSRSGYKGLPSGSGSCTSYGNTNYIEDMAESVAMYVTNPSRLKQGWPGRYEFIKDKIMNGKEFKGNEWK